MISGTQISHPKVSNYDPTSGTKMNTSYMFEKG